MRLNNLTIENFMLIKEANISFPIHQNIIGILGEYADGSSRSNRAGKSSLIEAINYLLYGQSRVGSRGHARLVNRAAQAAGHGFYLRGDWTLDSGETLTVERSRSHKGEPTVRVSGHEGAGVAEVDQIISNMLGFTYDEWKNTAYFGQGDIHQFMTSTPKDKRDLLLTWLKQDRWENRRIYSANRVSALQNELNSLQIALENLGDVSGNIQDIEDQILNEKTNIIVFENSVTDYTKLISDIQADLNNSIMYEQIMKDIDRVQKEIGVLEEELDQAIENKAKYDQHSKDIEKLENASKKKLDKLDQEIKGVEVRREAREKKLSDNYNKKKSEVESEFHNDSKELSEKWYKVINELCGQITVLNNDKKKKENELNKLSGYKGICPVLKEACDRVNVSVDSQTELDEIIKELSVLVEQHNKAQESERKEYNQLLNDKNNALNNLDSEYRLSLEKLASEYGTEINSLERERKKIYTEYSEKIMKLKLDLRKMKTGDPDTIEDKLDKLEKEHRNYTDQIIEIGEVEDRSTLQNRFTESNDLLIQAHSNLAKCKESLNSYKQTLLQIRESIDRRNRLVKSVEEKSDLISGWDYCSYMFGSRGIPSEYIKNAFGVLEEDINNILGKLNSNLSIEFLPYKEGSTFEKTCVVCGTEFEPRKQKCSHCGAGKEKKRIEQLVLNIIDGLENQVSEFDLDSGGGKTLISFAVRLALLFLKVREGSCQIPMVVLDEIAGMLDPVNRGSIMNIVLNILTQEYNIEQIWWISHTEEINSSFENPLIVTRYDDYSLVDWR